MPCAHRRVARTQRVDVLHLHAYEQVCLLRRIGGGQIFFALQITREHGFKVGVKRGIAAAHCHVHGLPFAHLHTLQRCIRNICIAAWLRSGICGRRGARLLLMRGATRAKSKHGQQAQNCGKVTRQKTDWHMLPCNFERHYHK